MVGNGTNKSVKSWMTAHVGKSSGVICTHHLFEEAYESPSEWYGKGGWQWRSQKGMEERRDTGSALNKLSGLHPP